MRISQDPHFDQRWVIEPSFDDDEVGLFTSLAMVRAVKKSGSFRRDDFWFHGYADRRLKAAPAFKVLFAWLKRQKARSVWQPVNSCLSRNGVLIGDNSSASGMALYQVALVLLDRDKAMAFKLNITLFTEPEE